MSDTNLADGDGLEIATEEDFGIAVDDRGDLVPVKQQIPGTEKAIRCRPLPSGALERYQDVLEGEEADDGRIAELFEEFIVEGVGSDATEEWVAEVCPGYLVSGLIQALKNSSGYDVFLAVQQLRSEEIRRNAEVLQMFETDDLMALVDSFENGQLSAPNSAES